MMLYSGFMTLKWKEEEEEEQKTLTHLNIKTGELINIKYRYKKKQKRGNIINEELKEPNKLLTQLQNENKNKSHFLKNKPASKQRECVFPLILRK
ncbi:hypothetical protein K502DRAFT_353543 [Neoconidiobolus thromboides FSU 785]|nr:hypothetical protein K502DRAFT_353543 [Neoconidiobolus thromboides FSU 785]